MKVISFCVEKGKRFRFIKNNIFREIKHLLKAMSSKCPILDFSYVSDKFNLIVYNFFEDYECLEHLFDKRSMKKFSFY